MAKAADEMSHWAEYDYVVVNRRPRQAFRELRAILAAERLKRERQTGLSNFRAARLARRSCEHGVSACARERPRQRDEALDRNFLGARGRLDAGRGEQRAAGRRRAISGSAAASCGAGRSGLGHALQRCAIAGERLARAASARTSDDVTFGGGTKADGATSNRIWPRVRQPASTESRP